MPRQRDFLEYHKSIAAELRATKDRVQNLIGSSHWLTVGEHKEAVLRKVLRGHIAETFHVGTGFVCGPDTTSHQIDILISSRDKPILFEDGELRIVTPDMATGIVEVKTRMPNDLKDVLQNLANDIEMIRTNGNPQCMAGLFIYEPYNTIEGPERILRIVQEVANGEKSRVINWIAAGPDIFVRYWCKGEDVQSIQGPVWHSYCLHDLAHAYFLSNVIWDTCPHLELNMQYAWFPVEGGKENYRQCYVGLNDTQPHRW
ncbi:MAG: DUF6602 domain-containing protein [Methanothrix sp.]|jgi:hypothetical protein